MIYILPPDESVIHIEVGATNLLGEARNLRMSMLTFFGDKAFAQRFAPDQLNLGGIRLYTGLPWLSAGNMALSLTAQTMATAHFAGVDLFIDLTRFVTGDRLSALQEESMNLDPVERREQDDTSVWEVSFAVHEFGLSGASIALAKQHPRPSPGRQHQTALLSMNLRPAEQEEGFVQALASNGIDHLTVEHLPQQRESRLELWVMQEEVTDEGETSINELGHLNEFWLKQFFSFDNPQPQAIDLPFSHLAKTTEQYQLRILIPGIPELRSTLFQANIDPNSLDPEYSDLSELIIPEELQYIDLPPRGLLSITVSDENNQKIPATLRLYSLSFPQDTIPDGFTAHPKQELIHIIEEKTVWLPPGNYRYTITRGFEYEGQSGELEILPGELTEQHFILPHLNPIKNYLSFDGHVHAGPSPDSDVLILDRLRGAAAEGVSLVAGSDHEIITDWSQKMDDALTPWVLPIVAEEATATLPEHMNIYPLPPRSDVLRGDPPKWYGLGFTAFTDSLRERGATIIQLNHPRQGCNYLCIIGYDRETGLSDPTLDPAHLGFEQGEIWGWDFNAVELLNDPRPIFMDLDRPYETGFYEDWASFINLGHKVTGMGVTDVHSLDGMGTPVTLLKLTEGDTQAQVSTTTPEEMATAILEGRAQVSLGAWFDLSVNGQGLGETVTAVTSTSNPYQNTVELDFTLRALPAVDVTWIYLFVNCDLYQSWPADQPNEVIKHQATITLDMEEDAWITMMAFGDDQMPAGLPQYDPRVTPRVVTNPIYLDMDDDDTWTPPGGKTCLVPEGRRP